MFTGKGAGSYSTGVRASRASVAALIILSFLFVLSAAVVRAQEAPQVAPLNPKFVDYMAQREAAQLTGAPLVTTPPGEHPTGLIPSPIDFSYLLKSAASSAKAVGTSYPASYSLRTVGRVSPVKDQGSCGSCWAFGAIASVESFLMRTGVMDFSEQFIIDTHGFDNAPCAGGNENMAMADMARHGVFAENLYPYEYLGMTEPIPAINASAWAGAHVDFVQLIATGGGNSPVTANVKNAVYNELTAVAVGFNINQYSPYLVTVPSGTYKGDVCYYNYNDYTPADTGHEVAIVGWNDSFPKTNFGTGPSNQPPGNGAYLIKNSWGTWWGNSGYFWMSYYDKSLNTNAYVYNGVQSASTYNWTYQYDPLGWTTNAGYKSTTAWMANVFSASPLGKVIRAVSFYTVNPGTKYTVKIYNNCGTNPVGGTFKSTVSGTFTTAGYNTVTLPSAVTVSVGTAGSSYANFSVVVELTDTTGYGFPVPAQNSQSGYTDRSTVFTGQSYISSDGKSWSDMEGYGWRACLKAFGTAS